MGILGGVPPHNGVYVVRTVCSDNALCFYLRFLFYLYLKIIPPVLIEGQEKGKKVTARYVEEADRRSTLSMLSLFAEVWPQYPQYPTKQNACGTVLGQSITPTAKL